MRALRIWTDIAEWRWTPAVGLALGALTYVSLALLVIPDRIGDDERRASRSIGTFQSLRNRTSAFAASIAPSLTDSEASRADTVNAVAPNPPPSPPRPPHIDDASFPRRGFTPPLERIEPPAPPPPPPPPPDIVVQPPPAPPAEAPPAPPPPAPAAEAPAAEAPAAAPAAPPQPTGPEPGQQAQPPAPAAPEQPAPTPRSPQ